MTTIHNEIRINASPEQVWRVLANLEDVQHYNPLVAKTKYITDNKEGVGSARYCDFKPKGFSKERVTDWIPNKLLGMEVVESSFPMKYTSWKTNLITDGNGTLVSQDLEYEMKFGVLGKLLNALIMKKKYGSILQDIFVGLKKYVEK